jgi:hypothetical protein
MRTIDTLKARMICRGYTDNVTITHDGHDGVIFTWYYHREGSTATHTTMEAMTAQLLRRLTDPLTYMEGVIDYGKARVLKA